jgi:hypothetical protein
MRLIAWWLAKPNRVDAAADANLAAARLLPWPVGRIEPEENKQLRPPSEQKTIQE